LWTYTRLRNRCEKFADSQFGELFQARRSSGKATEKDES